jgi:hypothetical protein
LLTAVVLMLGSSVLATEMVGVPRSSTVYPAEVATSIAGKSVQLTLTGTAMRTRFVVNVYTLGSYVQKGSSIKSAEALAAADCPKRLHLVMERTVDGKDMADAFRTAIRNSHPEPAFNDEVNQLVQYMRASAARKGDHVYLTHVPGIGLQINIAGKADFLIKNVAFSKAIWEIYLGKKNIDEGIKKGLTSRL